MELRPQLVVGPLWVVTRPGQPAVARALGEAFADRICGGDCLQPLHADGQLFAQPVSSPLINTSAVAAERGRNILADRGEQAAIDLVLPLFAGPLRPVRLAGSCRWT